MRGWVDDKTTTIWILTLCGLHSFHWPRDTERQNQPPFSLLLADCGWVFLKCELSTRGRSSGVSEDDGPWAYHQRMDFLNRFNGEKRPLIRSITGSRRCQRLSTTVGAVWLELCFVALFTVVEAEVYRMWYIVGHRGGHRNRVHRWQNERKKERGKQNHWIALITVFLKHWKAIRFN